jgi:hypothetical protein
LKVAENVITVMLTAISQLQVNLQVKRPHPYVDRLINKAVLPINQWGERRTLVKLHTDDQLKECRPLTIQQGALIINKERGLFNDGEATNSPQPRAS